ncbi:MAG: hypothetical protein ACLSFB_05105 [[Clostridium] scindens]
MKKTTKRLLFPIFMATIIFTAACSAKTDTDNKKRLQVAPQKATRSRRPRKRTPIT